MWGAIDIEPDWGTPNEARAWLDDYGSAASVPYVNFGAASGCPDDSSDDGFCSDAGDPVEAAFGQPVLCGGPEEIPGDQLVQCQWSQRDIWSVSGGEYEGFPLPQIYREDGTQPRQWQKISLYGAQHEDARLGFVGALTQMGAYQDLRDEREENPCPGSENPPEDGWTQLYEALNSDPLTQQDELRWSTDIRWKHPGGLLDTIPLASGL